MLLVEMFFSRERRRKRNSTKPLIWFNVNSNLKHTFCFLRYCYNCIVTQEVTVATKLAQLPAGFSGLPFCFLRKQKSYLIE